MQFDMSKKGFKIICHESMNRNFEGEKLDWEIEIFWL